MTGYPITAGKRKDQQKISEWPAKTQLTAGKKPAKEYHNQPHDTLPKYMVTIPSHTPLVLPSSTRLYLIEHLS
jgi:hypothetical protein